jgi:hypothetical protein
MNWNRREVIVTGMGAVSPFGIGVGPPWNGIGAGQSGIDSIEDLLALDPAIWPTRDAGAVKYFSVGDHLKRHCEVRNEKSVQMGLVTAREALSQAGLLAQTDIAIPDANPVAVVAGSGHGILYPRTSVRSAGDTCKVDVQLAVEQPIDSFRADWNKPRDCVGLLVGNAGDRPCSDSHSQRVRRACTVRRRGCAAHTSHLHGVDQHACGAVQTSSAGGRL